MANGDPVEDDGVVVRRFDPTNERHYSVDEATGQKRMRSGAFRWDEEADYGVIGCSVYRERELIAAGSDRWGCIEADKDHMRVATAIVSDIRGVTRPASPTPLKPFDVIEDVVGPDVPDVAHALLKHDPDLKKADRYYTQLALVFDSHLDKTA